jgi:hypothetical protein
MYIVMDRIGIACGKGERADLGGVETVDAGKPVAHPQWGGQGVCP